MRAMLKKLLRDLAFRQGRAVMLYRRVCRPDGEEWAAWLRARGGLHRVGVDCYIQTDVTITDPPYVSIGNNVRLSGCTLFGHDGSVNMINRAFGLKLDAVGKIDIRDNVFIGCGAIVMPNVTIGPNAVVGAGAVVTHDVAPDSVVGGVPAKRICSLQELVERTRRRNESYPWKRLIEQRQGAFDADMQPELDRLRVEHFFA